MITYLYIKQHRVTKLKYFGATTQNPYLYKGSGTRWMAHLRKHGHLIDTLEIFGFDDHNKIQYFALNFSRLHNIVKSNEWANCKEEDGITNGGKFPKDFRLGPKNNFYGKTHTAETKKRMSDYRRQFKMTETQREAMIKSVTGIPKSAQTKAKISSYASRRMWVVNANGDLRHTTDINDPRLLSGEYHRGKIFKI